MAQQSRTTPAMSQTLEYERKGSHAERTKLWVDNLLGRTPSRVGLAWRGPKQYAKKISNLDKALAISNTADSAVLLEGKLHMKTAYPLKEGSISQFEPGNRTAPQLSLRRRQWLALAATAVLSRSALSSVQARTFWVKDPQDTTGLQSLRGAVIAAKLDWRIQYDYTSGRRISADSRRHRGRQGFHRRLGYPPREFDNNRERFGASMY